MTRKAKKDKNRLKAVFAGITISCFTCKSSSYKVDGEWIECGKKHFQKNLAAAKKQAGKCENWCPLFRWYT